MTLRQVLNQEDTFIKLMRQTYADDDDVLRIINYYDAARSVVLSRDERVAQADVRNRDAASAFAEYVKVYRQRAAYHRAQRKLWQRRCKAVFRLAHGRAPTIFDLDVAVSKDWKAHPPAADSAEES